MRKILAFLQHPKLFFDRSFSNSHIKQFFWLFAAMLIVLLVLLGLSHIDGVYNEDTVETVMLTMSGDTILTYAETIPAEMSDSVPLQPTRLTDILYLLFDPGSMSSNFHSHWYITLVALCGLVFFCGFFISVITNVLEQRMVQYSNGALHYRLNHHTVIIGYDKTVGALIHRLHQKNPNNFVLLQTSQPVSEVRGQLKSFLTKEEEKHLVIYAGEATHKEDLEDLQFKRCREIYVIGDSTLRAHDASVMHSVNLIAGILKELNKNSSNENWWKSLKTCYMQFTDYENYSLFQYANMKEDVRRCLKVLPFNFEKVWAQKVLVYGKDGDATIYTPIDSQGIGPKSGKHVHVILIGLNHMSSAMAEQVAHIAHFPNFKENDPSSRTHITMIGANAEQYASHFVNRLDSMFDLARRRSCSASSEVVYCTDGNGWIDPLQESESRFKYYGENFVDVQWEFIQGLTSDKDVRTYLKKAAEDKDAYTTIIFCSSTPSSALEEATQLPSEVLESENVLQVLVRQDDDAAIVEMLRTDKRFNKLHSFGQIDNFFVTELVPEYFGMLVNAYYCGSFGKKDENNDEKALVLPTEEEKAKMIELWHVDSKGRLLTISDHWSSIASADMRFVRMRSYGVNSLALEQCCAQMQHELTINCEEMGRTEHNRWVVANLLFGFRALTEDERNELHAKRREMEEEFGLDTEENMKKVVDNFSPFKKAMKTAHHAHYDICSNARIQTDDKGVEKQDEGVISALPKMLWVEGQNIKKESPSSNHATNR